MTTDSTPQQKTRASLVANLPQGEKGAYVKIAVTLPSEVYELIATEVVRRKMNKLPNAQLSAVIREAVVAHFDETEW
jgi:transcriptional regulator of met regulon